MSNLWRQVLAFAFLLLVGNPALVYCAEDRWEPYRFLLGEWVGEGEGGPGKGKGEFSFGLELGDKILVRKNHSEYPATAGRPAVLHDDLMVVYPGENQGSARAIYFDNEGHVIHYSATFSPDKQTLTFLSDTTSSGPRFRLSYSKKEDRVVHITFEIAPPGKPDGFKTYLEGRARHKGGRKPAETGGKGLDP